MICLDTTTKSLEIVLGAAKTTNDMDWNVYYYDVPNIIKEDQSEYKHAHVHGQTNGITTVSLVSAPPNGVTRNITHISVHNADTASKQVIIKMDIGGTERKLVGPTVAAAASIVFEAGANWVTI